MNYFNNERKKQKVKKVDVWLDERCKDIVNKKDDEESMRLELHKHMEKGACDWRYKS